jgi:hypothetical protein
MQWLSDFIYQIVTLFLFVISFSFALYFLSEKDQNKMLWCGFAAWVFVGAALAIYLSNKILIEPQVSGLLKPSDEPFPALQSSVPEGALLINFGGNFCFSKKSLFPVLNISGEDLLTITRSAEGIALNVRIYSPDGRIVAMVERNEFTINPNNYFKKKRPDKSTLIVYDQTGEEAINAHLSNRAYMIVTGKFWKPGYGMITVTSTGIHTPDGRVYCNAFADGDAATGAVFFFR